jgi:GNAT superfamily N-acetyltransferase
MQLIFSTEKNIVEEFDALLASYFDNENKGHIPLDMDWQLYGTMTEVGMCHTFTARDGRDKLIGVVMYCVYMHPHHRTTKLAMCDIIAVNPEYRKLGIATRLIEYAEEMLKSLGVHEMLHMHKLNYKVTPLFIQQGYEAVETVYRKKVA